ncbi:integrase catalytic domain-containing protein [Nephila pilipes]|uniref:Integrase catalytic domain-containing protein n=1 Tax=Nephila pilipes TaxID=299642 RepID=A0A8X6Q373_NEPPI|nr:integrase catalytic domain-containing protein [Nephila pilipes]
MPLNRLIKRQHSSLEIEWQSPLPPLKDIDFSRPMFLRDDKQEKKAYITLFTYAVTRDEFAILLTEIENIINLRQLTYVRDDKDDPDPLTSAHFLHLSHNDFDYPMQFPELFDKAITKESLRRRKHHQNVFLRQLWTSWKEKYLLQLRTAHKFKTPNVHENLKADDVLVEDTAKSKLS